LSRDFIFQKKRPDGEFSETTEITEIYTGGI